MVKLTYGLVIMACLTLFLLGLLTLAAKPAEACTQNTGSLIAGLVGPLIEQIDNPDIKAAINFVLPRVQNDLAGLLTNAKFKDDKELNLYLRGKGLDVVADLVEKNGGWRWLWKEIDRISPTIGAVLYREKDGIAYGVVPRALVELQREGRIPEGSTFGNLLVLRPFNLTASEEDWLARTAAEEWILVRAEQRASIDTVSNPVN